MLSKRRALFKGKDDLSAAQHAPVDPRKQRTRDFIQRLEKHGHHVELGTGMPGTRAQQHDASLAKDNGKMAPAAQKTAQDEAMAKGAARVVKNAAAADARADDAFGSSAPPTSTSAKPATPTPG